ncbi:uncharacterized protein I303_100764 [Kwoniella dejecticola CBS 10117]|uniref:Mitochondrial GTPase 1 n=1 Tax=Kwoniella dejecticola CBS 10117 TaxID=1296121 RepID=A0A1A6AFW1_9TREE|nr:mitochondrial GTPase 1 [Kwoniella dejecticola CBS 10117]OBR88946.1 mitochondrial GTPase 1 [Kwoniella dejecticola CBS 10117]
MSFVRPIFPYPAKIPSWFAGHMSRSLRELPTLLENIDLVIEARDARLPLTSINSAFDQLLSKSRKNLKGKGKEREKIVVYTKRDLAERRFEEPLRKAFEQHADQKIMFADTRSDKDVRDVLKHAVRIAKDNAEIIPDLRVLVIGMPNVGKSSLLNALRRVGLRKGKAFRTGAEAGITRKLTGTVKIYDEPSVYVYDTPGVMVPYLGRGVEGAEKGLKLALTAGIKESLFEQDAMVDYLLWKLNKRLVAVSSLDDNDPKKHKSYLSLLPLPPDFQPTDDLPTLLDALSERLGFLQKGGEKDHDATCNWLIRAFREGKLGEFTLDDLVPPGTPIMNQPSQRENDIDQSVPYLRIPSTETDPSSASDPISATTPEPVSSSTPDLRNQGEEIPLSASTPNDTDLDKKVSQAVQAYLFANANTNTQTKSLSSDASRGAAASSSSSGPGVGISLNQQKKADKRQRLEERDEKLRAKGINVPQRTWTNAKGGLGKGSKTGEAGKFARSRR